MYKLCYYRFGEVGAEYGIYKLFCCKPLYLTIILGRAGGFDRVRNAEIGNKKVELKYFEEAYTTQHWLVRVYKLKKPSNLNWSLPSCNLYKLLFNKLFLQRDFVNSTF